jgi:hypothetical protein
VLTSVALAGVRQEEGCAVRESDAGTTAPPTDYLAREPKSGKARSRRAHSKRATPHQSSLRMQCSGWQQCRPGGFDHGEVVELDCGTLEWRGIPECGAPTRAVECSIGGRVLQESRCTSL